MSLVNLSDIFEVMQWHEGNEHADGEHVGIFIKLPRDLSEQFPKLEKDTSPSHITVLFVGQFNEAMEDKLVDVVQGICSLFKPFTVKFGPKVKSFPNTGDGIVVHSPVKSGKLRNLHDALKYALLRNQIQVNNSYPDYKPHITIGYAQNHKEKNEMKQLAPEGEFLVNHVYIWGTSKPHFILLGK